jgi:hypothetical protein
MIKQPQIPQDDLMDVMEMTQKLERYILRALKDQDPMLAMSALISASVNCLWAQCNNFDEVVFFRNMLMEVLDRSIHHMKIKKTDKPAS